MPLYFAYGSNMDVAAMAGRCPASKPLGTARLARHRFFVMATGYASVARDPLRVVHGLLWDLALADVAALDAYEEVARGLFVKAIQPVLTGGGARRALVYIGAQAKLSANLRAAAAPEYMEGVIAAARYWGLPPAYVRELAGFAPAGERKGAAPAPATPAPKVRPRFATPFDRR